MYPGRATAHAQFVLKMRAPGALLPVGAWGEAEMPFENLGHMALIRKSARSCNVSERHIRLLEQPLGALDPLAQQKLMRACACRLPKQTGKVIGTEANLLR